MTTISGSTQDVLSGLEGLASSPTALCVPRIAAGPLRDSRSARHCSSRRRNCRGHELANSRANRNGAPPETTVDRGGAVRSSASAGQVLSGPSWSNYARLGRRRSTLIPRAITKGQPGSSGVPRRAPVHAQGQALTVPSTDLPNWLWASCPTGATGRPGTAVNNPLLVPGLATRPQLGADG